MKQHQAWHHQELLCSGILVLFTDVENDVRRQMER